MNKVMLIGRLTKDADVRYSSGDNAMAIARFNLAVDRRFKRNGDDQTADFIGCIAFGKTAEFVEKYLRKGTKVAVEGRIQTGSYTNKNGDKIYTTDIVVEQIEFAESKGAGNGSGSAPAQQAQQPAANDFPADDGFMNIPDGIDEELPFN